MRAGHSSRAEDPAGEPGLRRYHRRRKKPRVCLVGMQNLKHMTGFRPYERALARMGLEYDVIYVDKYRAPESTSASEAFPFKLTVIPSWPRWRKVREYFKFRKHVRSCLRQGAYDVVITWGLETAILLADILLAGRFRHIMNVRDYGPMAFPGVSQLIRILAKKSAMTTISSPAFRQWLPPHDYVPISSYAAKNRSGFEKRVGPIRLCFLGNVRFTAQDEQLMVSLANDARFVVQYFGVGSEVLEEFAMQNGIANTEFVGAFDPSDTQTLLRRADMINNLYGRGTPDLDTAISLKYFLALEHSLPLLVYSGTAMAEAARGIAFEFDGDYRRLADDLYAWYERIDPAQFDEVVDTSVGRATQEIARFETLFSSIIGR